MSKMKDSFKRIICMILSLAMVLPMVQVPVLAANDVIYLPQDEMDEEILTSGEFYLASSVAEIQENHGAPYLLKIGRGGEALPEAEVRLSIIDVTTKYGSDYEIKLQGSKGGAVENTDSATSVLEQILENTDAIEEENYTDGLVSEEGLDPETAEELCLEDLETLDEFLTEEVEGYAEEKQAYLEAVEAAVEEEAVVSANSLKDAKEIATGIKSDKIPMDGGNNSLANYTEEMIEALSLELDSAYLMISFEEGETEKYVKIIPKNNGRGDGDRMFSLNLFAASENAVISDKSGATVHIIDDEVQEAASVYFAQSHYYPEDGYIRVTVKREGAVNQMVSVKVKTEDGTAIKDRDYSQVDTEVVFPYGISERTINIPIRSDYIEGSAQFRIVMSDAVGCTIGKISTAYGEIMDNSVSYRLFAASADEEISTRASVRADAHIATYVTGDAVDLVEDMLSAQQNSLSYSYQKAVDGEWEMYTGGYDSNVFTYAHWRYGEDYQDKRYDVSGIAIDWTKSSPKLCYTDITVNTFNIPSTKWTSSDERWERRTTNVYLNSSDFNEFSIEQTRSGSIFGTSPTLRIHSIKPIMRPFEISLKGAEPLKFLNENGEYVDNIYINEVADANNVILRNASNTGTGAVVKFSGEKFTVTTSSKYAYIKGLKIVNNDTGASKILRDELPVGTTSVSIEVNNEFIKEHMDYVTFEENRDLGLKVTFSVQPILDYYDSTVRIYKDYRGEVSYNGNPVVEEGADCTVLTYHKGDKIRFTQTVKDSYSSSYTDSRIRFVTKDYSSADSVDNLRAYDAETNYCTILNMYSDVDVYPNFDKKNNHIIVRVARADVEKFNSNFGIFKTRGVRSGNYMEYTVVDSRDFASNVYYELSARAKNDGYTPVWRKINTNIKYSQGTFYFESTDDIERNIIYLTCEKADNMKYCLTGDAYYSNVTLNGGIEGNAWMPASGVYVLMGTDSYGVSDENGAFNTSGMYGINGMNVIYKTVASGKTEYKTAILSNEKVSQFGSSGVETQAYDVSIGTIKASPFNSSAPYVAAVVATNSNKVESGVVYINDEATSFTIAIANNGASYLDTDNTVRTENVTAVDLLVYESHTHQLKEVLSGARELTDVGGTSVWTYNVSFKKGENSRYSSSDELYIRITTDRVVGNGMGYDENGEVVELDVLKMTEYAPVNTGYTFVESNHVEPAYQSIDFPTSNNFMQLPLIGSMAGTFNIKKLSMTLSDLPNGGHRLAVGAIIKSQKLAQADAMLDNGGSYKMSEFTKAASDVSTMGEELRASGVSSIGMRSWGVAPIVGAYFDYGIKNVYYTDNVTQKFVFVGGGLYAGITGKFRHVQYFVIGTVPCYVGVNGEITGYLELGFAAVNEDTATADSLLTKTDSLGKDYKTLNFVVGANSYVSAYAGAGICGLLGVRGGFAFGASYVCHPTIKNLYPDYDINGGSVSLGLKFWVDAFYFSLPIPAVSLVNERFGHTKQIYESEKGELMSMRSGNGQDDSYVIVKPRGEVSEWLPESDNPMLRSTFVPDTSTVLLENGFDRADSQLLDMGDGRVMLAFIADDPERDDKDRTALMYSIYDNGTWSEPVKVQNDGTADFEPNLCDAGDKVIISWTSRAPELEYNSEMEFLKSLEVYTTTIDKSTLEIGMIERLTNDEFYDSDPKAAYDENTRDYMVYYLKSEVTGNDFMTSVSPTTNESVIVYMLYDAMEGEWARDYYYDNEVVDQEAEDYLVKYWGGQRFLASPIEYEDFELHSDPIIVDFNAISYNGLGVYTYTVDQDNNMDTDADRELFVQIYDFRSHSTYVPVRITNDNITDARPQLVRNGEHTYLFWFRNNEEVRYINVSDLIKKGVNSDGTIKADFEMKAGVVTYVPDDDNVNPTFGSYTAFVDKDGNLYVSWLQPVTNEDGSSGQEIYASAFIKNGTDGSSWSEGVRLTNSGAIHDEVAFVTDANGNLITVSNQYTIDLNDDYVGVDNVKLVATKYKSAGSLEITDVAYSNDAPQAGTTISVNAKIKNTGLKTAEGYTLKVYETSNGSIGDPVYEVTSDTNITPSSSSIATFEWTMPESYADGEEIALYMEIQEAETAETAVFTSENIKISPVYEIMDYSVEERDDGFYATYTVKNVGNADARDTGDKVVIEFSNIYYTGDGKDVFMEASVGALEINESKTFVKPLEIDSAYFEYGYVNAFIEVQDKDGNPKSKYDTFMIVLEHPYDISVNGDKNVTEISLVAGEALALDVEYAADEFYQGADISYAIADTSVATVKDGKLVANNAGETEMTIMIVPFGGEKTVKVVVASTPSEDSGCDSNTTKYTVTFDTNGGNKLDSVKVIRNAVIGKVETPVKAGFTFDGWYLDKELTKKADLNAKVTADMTLYAKWVKKSDSEEWNNPFVDIKSDDWFYESIQYVNENGLFNGTADDKFSPSAELTRAMLVTVLHRAEGTPETTTTSKFKDVVKGSYYEDAVAWAQENGIVKGISDDEFAPDVKITREQIATIIHRYAVYKGVEPATLNGKLSFKDAGDISSYAVTAMEWVADQEIIKGYDDNTVRPKNNATRAEAAVMLHRFLEKLNSVNNN
ncbi:MAG: S-layer homology domain-containing protein [Clostridia bacterium]|nr:S-layer homology domain-containing protein [Clostridia bacterium]